MLSHVLPNSTDEAASLTQEATRHTTDTKEIPNFCREITDKIPLGARVQLTVRFKVVIA